MRFFEIESITDKDQTPPEEKYAVEFLKRTYKRNEQGQFIMRLPFRTPIDNSAVLGRSKAYALNQFLSLERKQ